MCTSQIRKKNESHEIKKKSHMNKERAYKTKRIVQKLNVEMKESFEKITFKKIMKK